MSFDDSVVGYSTSATAGVNFNSDCGGQEIIKRKITIPLQKKQEFKGLNTGELRNKQDFLFYEMFNAYTLKNLQREKRQVENVELDK